MFCYKYFIPVEKTWHKSEGKGKFLSDFSLNASPSSLAVTPNTSITRNRWRENSLNATGDKKPEATRLPQRKPLISLHSSQRSVFSPLFAAWTVVSLFAYFSLLLSFGLLVSFCSLGFQVNLYGNTQMENAQITTAQFNGFLHCRHPSCDRHQPKESRKLAVPKKLTRAGPHQHHLHRLQGQKGCHPTSKDRHVPSNTTQTLRMSLDECICGQVSEWYFRHGHLLLSLLSKQCIDSPSSSATY